MKISPTFEFFRLCKNMAIKSKEILWLVQKPTAEKTTTHFYQHLQTTVEWPDQYPLLGRHECYYFHVGHVNEINSKKCEIIQCPHCILAENYTYYIFLSLFKTIFISWHFEGVNWILCCLSLLTFQTIYVNQTRELNYANRTVYNTGIKFRAFPVSQTDSLKSSVQQVKFYETGADIFVVWGLFFLSYQVKFIPKVGKL